MNCSNCHRDIPDDALLCPYCGHEQQAETLGVCQNCDRTIPDDAVLCPYCGHQVGRQSLRQVASSLSITSPRFLQIQALLFFVWCVICSCCSVSSFFFGSRDISTTRRLPTSTVTLQYARQSPTSIVTPEPTTQSPTLTATPEPTKAIAPPYTEIAGNRETMTEAQWNNYVDQIVGTWVTDWPGWIDDVNEKTFEGYELWIDMDPPDEMLSVYDVTFDMSDEVALQITKDNPITFSGKITAVTDILGVGLVITLEEAEWSIE